MAKKRTKAQIEDCEEETNIKKNYLNFALQLVPFEGWTKRILDSADQALGHQKKTWRLYFPEGEIDLISFWSEQLNQDLQDKINQKNVTDWRVRDKIRWAVKTRLTALRSDKEAASRARNRLLMPDAGLTRQRLNWQIADVIWIGFKDPSMGRNYYSKRLILAKVYAVSFYVWLCHEEEESWAFLDRRIENVMSFEKFKAKLKKPHSEYGSECETFSKNKTNLIETLANLRYQTARFFAGFNS